MLGPRVQRDAADDDCRPDAVVNGDRFAEHEVRERQSENDGGPLEQVGVAHGHALDNLLPKHGVNSQHSNCATNSRHIR